MVALTMGGRAPVDIEAIQGAAGPDAESESRRASQGKSYLCPTKPGVCFRPIADLDL